MGGTPGAHGNAVGDFDGDGERTAADVDQLLAEVRLAQPDPPI